MRHEGVVIMVSILMWIEYAVLAKIMFYLIQDDCIYARVKGQALCADSLRAKEIRRQSVGLCDSLGSSRRDIM